jgi:hypothetical protein
LRKLVETEKKKQKGVLKNNRNRVERFHTCISPLTYFSEKLNSKKTGQKQDVNEKVDDFLKLK